MIHFSSDGFGGFYVFEDPVFDFGGSVVSILVASFFTVAPLVAIISSPELFLPTVTCLLGGLFLRIFCSGNASFYFLSPFALPMYSYALFSGSYALMISSENADPLSIMNGFIMMPVIIALLLVGALVLFVSLFGEKFIEDHEGVAALFVLGIGAFAFISAVSQNNKSGVAIFSMRAITLIAIIWAIVNFVGWCIQAKKGNIHWQQMFCNLKLAGLGLLPLAMLILLKPITRNSIGGIMIAILTFLIYGALSVLAPKITEQHNKQSERNVRYPGGIMIAAPLFFVIIMFFSGQMIPNVLVGFSDVMVALAKTPLQALVESICAAIANSFGVLYETVAYGITSLLAEIFNERGLHIQISPIFSILLTLVLNILFMALCISVARVTKGKAKKEK